MPGDLDDEWRRINAFGDPAGPRDWSPSVDPLASARDPRGGRRGLWLVGTVAVVIVAVVGVAVALGRGSSASDGTPGQPIVLATGGNGQPAVVGLPSGGTAAGTYLDARTPVGTCLSAGAPEEVEFVACSSPHRFELVSHVRAGGTDYPSDDYWSGPIGQRCFADMLTYTGRPRDQWPDGLDSTSFVPQEAGWKAGDRSVYCVADWAHDATTSVKDLPVATTSPAAVPTDVVASSPPATVSTDVDTVLAGRLVSIVNPTPHQASCIGVVGDGGTWIVSPASNALSWWVAVDDAGRTIDAQSGILRGSDPMGTDFLAHTGAPVTLTGRWIRYSGPSVPDCGATRVFAFTGVG